MDNPQLAALLQSIAPYLRPELAKAFERLSKRLDQDPVERLQEVAREVAGDILRTKGGKAALIGTASLLSQLETLSKLDGSACQKFSEVRSGFDHAALASGNEKSGRAKSSEAPEEKAKHFAARLEDAKRDRDRFEVLLQDLNNAKLVNTATLHRIAQIFIGRDKKYKGRKPAIEDIQRRHNDELRFAYQDRMLERLR